MKKIALLAGTAILIAGNAAAEFEIEEPRTASQEVALELTNSIRVGDVSSGQTRSEHSVGVNYGAFEYWTTGFAIELENRQGDSFDLGGIEWSNNFQILGTPEGEPESAFALSLYSSFEFSFDGSQDVEFNIGPAFEYNSGAVALRGNTFFNIPASDDEEVGLQYALGTMYALSEDLELGVEAHGDFESIFKGSSDISEQEHFAGPAMNYEFVLDNSEVEAHFGAFYGLTDATPTVGIAANLEFGF
jgi:opacity protein-like surface antigen